MKVPKDKIKNGIIWSVLYPLIMLAVIMVMFFVMVWVWTGTFSIENLDFFFRPDEMTVRFIVVFIAFGTSFGFCVGWWST